MLFRQFRSEAPESFIMQDAIDVGTFTTRWNMKKLLPAQYNGTVLKRRSIENFLRLTYNLLLEAELIPIDLRKPSTYRVKTLITNMTASYVVDNKHLFAYYFKRNYADFDEPIGSFLVQIGFFHFKSYVFCFFL